ncbi:beta carbonic anhydrase 1-like [Ylistrum balloti]|uniref:beta carbonic anhydrase 1-like n=1 Tax=Ylistrum balloti TaxID=509963 RepID=UPI0029059ECB|nr:beta carbonic anhydrase 1-like [Ylistrum balloti]
MPGIEKLLMGILRYRVNTRWKLLEQFQRVKNNPEPTSVFFTCIDSRVLATKFMDSQVGDNFVVRSAGNLIPHACNFSYETATTEAGALELGCIVNGVKHVVVCGHSDCKAMNLLYSMRNEVHIKEGGPLQLWMKRHGTASLEKFKLLTPENEYKGPVPYQTARKFEAYIDPENRFNLEDKLSQVNCLQQLQNIASYPFLKDLITRQEVKLHAMWFDIYTGEVFMFSRTQQKFIEINDQNINHLLHDAYRKVETIPLAEQRRK